MCEKCGKEVSPFEMPEHLDFHYAQEMELREKEIFASDQAVKKRPAPLKDSSSEEEESEDEDDSEEDHDEEGSNDDQNYYEASEADESSKSFFLKIKSTMRSDVYFFFILNPLVGFPYNQKLFRIRLACDRLLRIQKRNKRSTTSISRPSFSEA